MQIEADNAEMDDEVQAAEAEGETVVAGEGDEEQGEQIAAESEGGETDSAAEGEGDDLVVSIGDEQAAQQVEDEHAAPPWVKDLRKQNREMRRELARLREASRTGAAPIQEPELTLPPKPALTDPDIDFDAEKLAVKLEGWFEQRQKVEEAKSKRQAAQQAEAAAWKAKLDAFAAAKSKLKVRDYEDAEAAVVETLSVQQQGIILKGAARPEVLIYALGKNTAKAKELAAIADPIEFAFAVAKLEKDVKLTPRAKLPPPPEKRVSSTVPGATVGDARLAELQRKARETGDYTAYLEAKRKAKAHA